MLQTKKEISWDTLEFEHHEKGPRWYITLVIIGIAMLLYALWMRDVTQFLILFIILFATYLFARRKPRTITITLTGTGIEVGEVRYPFSRIKNFWFVYEPPHAKLLYLTTSDFLIADVPIELDKQDPNEIREFLIKYLPEDQEKKESFVDQLMRRL